ncbi:MAG: hypothetical protein J1E95_00830 [Muribaculaceae bacterium]|nr:hypothetical protein [Muribaculaceae bacterium]
MKKHFYLIAALGLGIVSCTDSDLKNDGSQDNITSGQESDIAKLTTIKLNSSNSSQDRINVYPSTRDENSEKPLELIAEIKNISEDENFDGFTKEDRLLSATCVYYDKETQTYYATYHMQGNNYYTDQEIETSGYIESFQIEGNTPKLEKIYWAADASGKTYDFNHLYFDDLNKIEYVGEYTGDKSEGTRIIVAGHSSEPVKTGTGFNTKAIIGKIDFEQESLTVADVMTGDKIYDENITNKDGSLASLGDEDAADVNCVVRKYNHYYLTTRKGVAVLKAGKENLFQPETDVNDKIYFLKTPGSAKFISQPTFTSGVDILYLTQYNPEELTKDTSSPANVIQFALDTTDGKDLPIHMNDVDNFSWSNLISPNQLLLGNIESISPVDGKNVLVASSNNTGAIYTCLGRNGLYVFNPTYDYKQDEIIKFTDAKEGNTSRPVNGIYVEDWDDYNGHHYTDGFIYVANGACLTILDAKTLEKVAEYSAFDGTNAISANYVHVVKSNTYTNEHVPDRIITVAYGQAGVKVFRFVPPTK